MSVKKYQLLHNGLKYNNKTKYKNVRTNRGFIPELLIHAKHNNIKKVLEALNNNFDDSQNRTEDDYSGVLHYACMNDNNELVGKILELGYDIDSRNEFFVTPLMIATRFGSNECIKVLLKHNADINKTDTFGWTALQFTTNENTKDLLIKNGAKISNNCIEKKYTVNHDNDFTFIEFL